MSLTFKPRAYTCLDCKHKGKIILAFSSTRNVSEYFPKDRILDPIEDIENNSVLYEQILERDDFGLVTKRVAVKCKCEKCSSTNLEAVKVDSDANVLNFYPAGQSEKWLSGFSKQIN